MVKQTGRLRTGSTLVRGGDGIDRSILGSQRLWENNTDIKDRARGESVQWGELN